MKQFPLLLFACLILASCNHYCYRELSLTSVTISKEDEKAYTLYAPLHLYSDSTINISFPSNLVYYPRKQDSHQGQIHWAKFIQNIHLENKTDKRIYMETPLIMGIQGSHNLEILNYRPIAPKAKISFTTTVRPIDLPIPDKKDIKDSVKLNFLIKTKEQSTSYTFNFSFGPETRDKGKYETHDGVLSVRHK